MHKKLISIAGLLAFKVELLRDALTQFAVGENK